MITLAASDSIQASAGTGAAVTSTLFGDEISAGVDAFKILDQRQLPLTTPAVLYTPGGTKSAIVKKWLLANTTSSIVVVTLYLNGTAAANQIASLPIPPNGEVVLADDGWHVYDANGALLTVGSSTSTTAKNYSARVYARLTWR